MFGMELDGYSEESRSYRPTCCDIPELRIKVFHEKDVPVQVAVGNYDLGICGLDWVEELLVKYPSSALVKIYDLGYGKSNLCVAVAGSFSIDSLDQLKSHDNLIRLAGEYPNLAESIAMNLRLKRFSVFPLWGAAEVYPPENADIVLLSQTRGDSIPDYGLVQLMTLINSSAFLIANRHSWETKDLSQVLQLFRATDGHEENEEITAERAVVHTRPMHPPWQHSIRLALPDGHQNKPTVEFLHRAGVELYDIPDHPRRPSINMENVATKLIRPQDMPLQVANGNFDLAITGQDWLRDHLCKFPDSPVKEIVSLGFGGVRIVAVMKHDTLVRNTGELRSALKEGRFLPLRIASEYINIADKYARDHHLGACRIMPTWGASEAFLPEDADLLIENTQTGKTLVQHNLDIIDTIMESSACLIGRADVLGRDDVMAIVERLKQGIQS